MHGARPVFQDRPTRHVHVGVAAHMTERRAFLYVKGLFELLSENEQRERAQAETLPLLLPLTLVWSRKLKAMMKYSNTLKLPFRSGCDTGHKGLKCPVSRHDPGILMLVVAQAY
eukprot:COSAG02_NODE_10487_length_1931_cov_1.963428_3_plen_114_part_00